MFVSYIEENENSIIGSTTSGQRLAGLYFRTAQACLNAGQRNRALRHLECACYFDKKNDGLQEIFSSVLSDSAPPVNCRNKSKTAILMLSCDMLYDRAEKLAEYISANVGYEVFVVTGNPHAEAIELIRTRFGNRIIVPCEDGYAELSKKLILAYRYLYCCTDCSSVFKIDDDVIVKESGKFSEMLDLCYNSTFDYIGAVRSFSSSIFHHGAMKYGEQNTTFADHSPVDFCDGGQGYYLSRNSLRHILKQSLTYYTLRNTTICYEDVLFGEMLKASNISPKNWNLPILGGYVTDCYEPLKLIRSL